MGTNDQDLAERLGAEVVPEVQTYDLHWRVLAHSAGHIRALLRMHDTGELRFRPSTDPIGVHTHSGSEYSQYLSVQVFVPKSFEEPPLEPLKIYWTASGETYLERVPPRGPRVVSILAKNDPRGLAYLDTILMNVVWKCQLHANRQIFHVEV